MGKSEDPGSYEVGYGRPRKGSQVRKGRSGNPSGRPKGSLNTATVLRQTLSEKVTITENGRRKSVSKLQAGMTQLADKAVAGDLKAIQILNGLMRSVENSDVDGSVSDPISDEADKQVLLGILKRIKGNTEDPEDENEAATKS